MKNSTTQPYDDIIDKPHHVSSKHPQMERLNRAAQFAPFAALTGYEEAIIEKDRRTEEKRIVDENKKMILDEKLQILLQDPKEYPLVNITYFQEDRKKEGGEYLVISERIKKIDTYYRTLILMNGMHIKLDDIYEIEM